ncbi:MAG TPA: response regulator transcription factor [Candidatus Micrarchaeaceae archaeon]|nr:response regulator transcription factor [Candidatus Micrarchaeaceae archaeon]
MRILVAEDDRRVAENVRTGLERAGFAVDIAMDGKEALTCATTVDYDAIVLDVMLPELDGIAVSRALREGGRPMPILMLTALDAVIERVAGLEAGADDYLAKPFAMVELVARVKALLRRRHPGRSGMLGAGVIQLDTGAHTLQVMQVKVELTAKEFAILEYLMVNRGQLVSRAQMLEHVWGFELEGGDNLVEVLIGRIRRKLRDAGAGDPIKTIRGAGYRFDVAVA